MASIFIIDNDSVRFSAVRGSSTLFDDVEIAKRRIAEARRLQAEKVSGSSGSEAKQQIQSSDEQKRLNIYSSSYRLMVEEESDLFVVRAAIHCLKVRRDVIWTEMAKLKGELDAHLRSKRRLSVEPHDDAPEAKRLRTSKRYFEQVTPTTATQVSTSSKQGKKNLDIQVDTMSHEEDLSSIICSYELLGQCMDPSCPHMHLNR